MLICIDYITRKLKGKTNFSGSEGALKLTSPKNKRRTMVRLYQALGNAKISVNLLMSYLNEADPISMIAISH